MAYLEASEARSARSPMDDAGDAGGAYAAPVARAILQKWLEKKQRPAAAPKEPIFKPVLSQ